MALLDDVKAHLRILDGDSDVLLQRLVSSAEAECLRYTGLTAGDPALTLPDVVTGIVLAVQADYDGDPQIRSRYMAAAHALWNPHCLSLGV